MQVRDRIRELRRVPADTLRPNPANWRTHPVRQHDALRGVLAEVGYASALVARELEDGSLELIDGHLRAETTPEMEVPVLVVDVSADEARLLLATLDPLASLAESDAAMLRELTRCVATDNEAVRQLLDDLTRAVDQEVAPIAPAPRPEVEVPELYQVVVECGDEAEQRSLYERLTGEGFTCRVRLL